MSSHRLASAKPENQTVASHGSHTRPMKIRPAQWIIPILMWFYALLSVAPFALMVVNSVRPSSEVLSNPVPGPFVPTFDNFISAWTVASFQTYFMNSMIVTVSSIILTLGVSVPAAYALARWNFYARNVLENLFVLGLLIPLILIILPLFYIIDFLRLIDSPLSLILIYTANGIPFSVFVLSVFFRRLPGELDEAAHIDGVGPFGIFLRIMVPLIKPAIVTVAVFRFVPIYNDFLFPLIMLRSKKNFTISVGLMSFFGDNATDWASLFAALVIASVPLVVLFLFATRQIVDGLTAGLGK